jgi:metal-responsive CopG/Arc/MetJ family transcriptional regulator
VKVSVTLDPSLLDGVDAYIRAHKGLDRSKVIDLALIRWCTDLQESAIEAQHRTCDAETARDERADWRSIRRAAATRRLRAAR